MGYQPMMYPQNQMGMHPPPMQQAMRPQKPPPSLNDMALRRGYQWPNTASRYFRGIHDFEITKQLGKGGFSEVFKGKSKKDGKIYAVKKVAQL